MKLKVKDGKYRMTDVVDIEGMFRISFKGLIKESLRDNMSDIEATLADLGEIEKIEIAKKKNPKGLDENIEVARRGGNIAGNARKDLENELGESVVTSNNALNYEYVEQKEIETK